MHIHGVNRRRCSPENNTTFAHRHTHNCSAFGQPISEQTSSSHVQQVSPPVAYSHAYSDSERSRRFSSAILPIRAEKELDDLSARYSVTRRLMRDDDDA